MAKRRRRGNPVLRQAQLEAEVKYNSPAHTLAMLLGQTRTDLKNQIRVEQGTARGIEASAQAAIPQVRSYYQAAQGQRAQAQGLVDSKLAPLSSAADDIKAASAREAGGFQTRLAEQGAAALTDFQQRGVQAKAGAQFAISNARRQNRDDQAKILDQLVQLGRERGTFTAATYESLKDADRKLGVTKAGNKETKRHHKAQEAQDAADAAAKAAKAAADAKKPKPGDRPTRTQRVAAQDKYDQGVILAGQLRKGGKDSTGKKVPPATEGEIVQILTAKLGSAVLAKAAAQTVIYRGVGPKTRKFAHRRYGIKLPGFPDTPRPAPRSVGATVGQGF